MKCPICGAPSGVLGTRQRNKYTRRERKCFNEHRFSTYEVHAAIVTSCKREVDANFRANTKRAETWKRDQRIIRDTRGASAVAADYGITETRVRQIRGKQCNER